jgi:coenzyme F420-reducing hydrogenase alpha subunit
VIRIGELSRVEGLGRVRLDLKNGAVLAADLDIFEPPRLFEGILRGRSRLDVPDITARICGICPIAYFMSSCQALEAAAGVRVTGPLRDLRRLFYCGEWIASHGLHVFLLQAPDFFGQPDGLALADVDPALVEAGLALKKAGNAIVTALGGREIHPVNLRVGGFYRTPRRAEVRALLPGLCRGRDATREAIRASRSWEFPDFERDWELVALVHPDEYPMNEGRLASTAGLDLAVEDFDGAFEEYQVGSGTALRARIRGRGAYLCGPLARFALNFERLAPAAREAARDLGLPVPCRNPFRAVQVRLIELLHAFEEAIRLAEAYEPPPAPAIEVPVRAGVGHGCTEAPRGALYHRYQVDDRGRIVDARIVTPTGQGLASIEDDLVALGPRLAALPLAAAGALAERAVRNHDPCISCSTHLVEIEATGG